MKKAKYLLKFEGKEIESADVGDLLRIADGVSSHYEIFRCFMSSMESKKLVDDEKIFEVNRLWKKGYQVSAISYQLSVSNIMVRKILRLQKENKLETI